MKTFRLLIISAICLLVGEIYAQGFCATKAVPMKYVGITNPYLNAKAASTVPDTCIKKVFSIAVHITLDSLKKTNCTMAAINGAIAVLNADFAKSCMQFQICSVDTIENWRYDALHTQKEEFEVLTMYYKPRTINLYYVETFEDIGAAGYAAFPGSCPVFQAPEPDERSPHKDYIFIKKSAISSTVVHSHEFGHYFGLYHTFETSNGLEFSNGSNCATTGDLICDTEADVNPATFNPPGSCNYDGNTKDPNGDFLTPPIGNIMSYHPEACKCPFTTQQFNRMVQTYVNCRRYLF